ncbi:MAG: cytochrome c oxidase assembly protein [Thermoleophilia bacterium]|nr:cytochrome c oxidase assembly protein [Thermoleophilia bacterium]
MEPSPWAWEPAWVEAGVVAALGAGALVAQHRGRAPARRRLAAGGATLLALATVTTPLETLATTYLLSAHVLQNAVLSEWAPALAVAAIGPAVAARLARRGPLRTLVHPLVALPVWLATLGVWHVPALYEAALARPGSLLMLEHASYAAAGTLLFWPAFQREPRALSPGAKAGYLTAAFLLASPLGLLLTFLPSPLYRFYEEAPRAFELSPLGDQQLAGVVMAASEAVLFFGLFALFFLRFLAEEDRVRAQDPTR